MMFRICSTLRPPVCAVFLALALLGGPGPARAAEAPQELAGIRLGQTVEAMGDRLVPAGANRAFHRPFIGIMPVAPVPGYRSGYVDYGLCAKPGRIVRIKMHYNDDSLAFFNRVMAALTKRYGDPKEWRGNAFGTLRTWKWGLRSGDGQPVSLILMHYEGEDGAFTEGNSIRIAATSMVREEERCQAEKQATIQGRAAAQSEARDAQSLGPDWFLPR
jgi:hypothetical protein